MSRTIDILNPEEPKQVAIVASNPSISKQTGWPIGFWWSELTHPYWEFAEHGYKIDIYSPDGGKLLADNWSDPRDESKYSADDLDGNLITGQQQFSGMAVARLVIEALGV